LLHGTSELKIWELNKFCNYKLEIYGKLRMDEKRMTGEMILFVLFCLGRGIESESLRVAQACLELTLKLSPTSNL
jgi:hypothetical protein